MVLARMLAGTAFSVGEVLPIAVAVVYGVYQVPSNIFPWRVVEKLYKMRDEEGQELQLTLKTKRLFDRELCESGVENIKIVDVQVRETGEGGWTGRVMEILNTGSCVCWWGVCMFLTLLNV